MKRLMLLGGSKYQIPIIEAAHMLGYFVITCDYLPSNIAHKYSDQYCNVSIVDKEAVLRTAKEMRIDGIMSFACDPGVITAAYVAQQLGLPSAGPYESICILQNKGRFRHFLADNGFNVPMAKSYRNKYAALEETDMFHWPVIVKPTDSAGSKGVSLVKDPKRLLEAIERAVAKSLVGEYIIEDYLEQVGYSSDSDSFSVDGVLRFVSFNAQRFDATAQNPYVPAAYSWPSTLTPAHQQELTSELQRLIQLLGLRSSIYNIETRECIDGKAYIMECSPRGGGNRLAEMLRYATGVDLVQAAVLAAVGEPLPQIKQEPVKGYWAEVILHSNHAGTFERLWISEEIRDCVIEEDLWLKPGDQINHFDGANNAIGTLILRFENECDMTEAMRDIWRYVRVL